MNANKMSGEIGDKKMSGKIVGGELSGEVVARETAERKTSKKNFPIGWFLTAAALSFFVGHLWSYLPVVRGIVSLLVFSKFLAGLSGTHLLL